MRTIVFDTETTGLPKFSRTPAKFMRDNWPHIVSLSWMVLENDTVVETHSYIVKPKNWVIPDESIAIHGITNEIANKEGVELEHAIDNFMYQHYDLMLAHNLDFDENVIVNAIFWDLNRKNFLEFPHPKRCSMKLSRDICKIPTLYKAYKSPKLSELYRFVFGKNPEMDKLHGSLYDVEILVKIIQNSPELRDKLGLTQRTILQNNVRKANSNVLSL
jgi:DNA polymerase III epsilon subunit-like protein